MKSFQANLKDNWEKVKSLTTRKNGSSRRKVAEDDSYERAKAALLVKKLEEGGMRPNQRPPDRATKEVEDMLRRFISRGEIQFIGEVFAYSTVTKSVIAGLKMVPEFGWMERNYFLVQVIKNHAQDFSAKDKMKAYVLLKSLKHMKRVDSTSDWLLDFDKRKFVPLPGTVSTTCTMRKISGVEDGARLFFQLMWRDHFGERRFNYFFSDMLHGDSFHGLALENVASSFVSGFVLTQSTLSFLCSKKFNLHECSFLQRMKRLLFVPFDELPLIPKESWVISVAQREHKNHTKLWPQFEKFRVINFAHLICYPNAVDFLKIYFRASFCRVKADFKQYYSNSVENIYEEYPLLMSAFAALGDVEMLEGLEKMGKKRMRIREYFVLDNPFNKYYNGKLETTLGLYHKRPEDTFLFRNPLLAAIWNQQEETAKFLMKGRGLYSNEREPLLQKIDEIAKVADMILTEDQRIAMEVIIQSIPSDLDELKATKRI